MMMLKTEADCLSDYSAGNPESVFLSGAIERLVGEQSPLIPANVMSKRREFFEHLVLLNKQQGVQLIAPPCISKLPVDLHRLYLAVRRRGGFKQVIKDKSWKMLCSEANPQMQESSAAGYQLRLHYQKYLLYLECNETDQNYEELKAFANSLRKRKKDKITELHMPMNLITEESPLIQSMDPFATEDYSQLFFQEEQQLAPKFVSNAHMSYMDPFVSDMDYQDLFFDNDQLPVNIEFDPMLSHPVRFQYESLNPTIPVKRIRTMGPDIASNEEHTMEDMAQRFKNKRMQLDYSQKDVALSICGCFQTDMSQTTISRFETCKLSPRNMDSVRQLLDDWLEKVDEALKSGKTAADFLKETKQTVKR